MTIALEMRHADRLTGIHLNFIFPSYRPYLETGAQLAPPEEEYIARMMRWTEESGAYAHLQATRPQTPAYGLNDSPAGLAAWIVEKFREWSDCNGDVYRPFTRDELLANVTLYWMTETIHSSFRIYLENRKAPLQFARGDFIRPPCAVALFPKEIPLPPRQWVERGFNVQQWTEMPRGGHFAAMEEPELLAADIQHSFEAGGDDRILKRDQVLIRSRPKSKRVQRASQSERKQRVRGRSVRPRGRVFVAQDDRKLPKSPADGHLGSKTICVVVLRNVIDE